MWRRCLIDKRVVVNKYGIIQGNLFDGCLDCPSSSSISFSDNEKDGMRNELVHIAMASNRRYLPGLRATIISLIRAASEPQCLVFHVFSDGLTMEDKESLVCLVRQFGYEGRFDFREPDIGEILSRFKAYNDSLMPVLRLYFPEIFSELDWILWTDVDVLWFRDPISFWAERDDSVSLVWSRDIPSTRKAAVKHAKFPIVGDKDGDWKDYACSGVMLMNLRRLRNTGFLTKCVDFVNKWGSPFFPDQDILNFICGKDAKLVDGRWDLLYPVPSVEDGVVIHFNGIGPKFNDSSYTGMSPLYEIWFRFVHQIVDGQGNRQICPLWKRAFFTAISILYPVRRVISFFTDPIHPWCSDFIQRTLLFSWLRRKVLWK